MSSFTSFLRWITIVTAMIMGSFLYGDADALEPMEVSALRLETASENLPARIQVLDQADIEQSGAVDLVELLRREANLQVRSTSGIQQEPPLPWVGLGRTEGFVLWYF